MPQKESVNSPPITGQASKEPCTEFSAIRNRTGKIIGLTCRVGRAISGTINVIRDLVESNKSISVSWNPQALAKLPSCAKWLVCYQMRLGKRVIVIDTSNEIAGDGDVPHPAIGRAQTHAGVTALKNSTM